MDGSELNRTKQFSAVLDYLTDDGESRLMSFGIDEIQFEELRCKHISDHAVWELEVYDPHDEVAEMITDSFLPCLMDDYADDVFAKKILTAIFGTLITRDLMPPKILSSWAAQELMSSNGLDDLGFSEYFRPFKEDKKKGRPKAELSRKSLDLVVYKLVCMVKEFCLSSGFKELCVFRSEATTHTETIIDAIFKMTSYYGKAGGERGKGWNSPEIVLERYKRGVQLADSDPVTSYISRAFSSEYLLPS